ncbi:MAG: universal stress protein [Cupriavidus sp.]|nr:MAG: universal stress protein [Cupriavidus sp.]
MYSRLLVPLDGSPTANLALHHAAVLARMSGATVVLLHIIEEMKHSNGFERPMVYINEVRPGFLAAGQKLLDEAAQRLRQEGLGVETVLLESQGERVSELIAQQALATRCDLVVLGTHGRRGVDRLLLGSDAEQLARIASVPVMLVRQSPTATSQPGGQTGAAA